MVCSTRSRLNLALLALWVLVLAALGLAACGELESETSGERYEPSADAYSGGGDAWSASDTASGADASSPGTSAGRLTAGEWRDLDHWDFWLDLMNEASQWQAMLARWGMTLTERVAVEVLSNGLPAVDVAVVLRGGQEQALWTARTDNRGRAELFLNAFAPAPAGPYSVEVADAAGGLITLDDVQPMWMEAYQVELPEPTAPENLLDLMVVIDTTGSMGDELSYLQSELADVLQRVRETHGESLVIRLSVNFYRDHDDEYVVRSFPFSTDLEQVLSDLRAQSSDGGGDWEEAVEEALDDAVRGHAWSVSARARLIFLVLDAPPHHNSQVVETLQAVSASAAEQGIRLVPLTGTGIDKDSEFLLRGLAIASAGTYVFLTDDSGIGGTHLPSKPTVGEHEVETLNDLLVRLVDERLE